MISNVLGALTTVEHSMPLVQYAACHKSYPFQEKFPAICINRPTCGDPGIFVRWGVQVYKKIKNLRHSVFFGFFMPPKELREAYSNCTVRLCVRPSVPLRVRCISPRFFEVGIPNLVCGYILGWRSVAYHFRVTVTLTSDLVFRIILSGAYPLYYLR